MDTSANNTRAKGRQAIKYIGRYKPNRTYLIGNGLVIIPAGSDMIEYGCGSSTSKIRHNISYLASDNETSAFELTEKYREWLAFDAFILNDGSPIRAFDAQKTGRLETIPHNVPEIPSITDYFQPDYDNIHGAMFGYAHDSPELPKVCYSEAYQKYLHIPTDTKELIEWFVSFPTHLSQTYCRDRVFFNPNYWRIFHTTILIERIIGLPDKCPRSPKTCACGSALHPHHAITRRQWLRQFIASRIADNEIAKDYVRTIETGYEVRNRMAHGPQFDRSTHEAPLEQPEIYDSNRAATDYKQDSAALMLLVMSLNDLARNLLLNVAFDISFFSPLRQLISFPVK